MNTRRRHKNVWHSNYLSETQLFNKSNNLNGITYFFFYNLTFMIRILNSSEGTIVLFS